MPKTSKTSNSAPNPINSATKTPQKPSGSPQKRSHPSTRYRASHKRKLPAWALILALLTVVGGSLAFIAALSSAFDHRTVLDPEYYASEQSASLQDGDFIELLTPESYASLVENHKSFLIFIDQVNCVNANRMRGFITSYNAENGPKMYRIMYSDMRKTPLVDQVRYYPSVVIVENGTPVKWLDADSDADADAFNDYDAFKSWLNSNISI